MHKKRTKLSTVTMGVAGIGTGAGTTHFCIMLAVFLAVVKGYDVALVEQNDSGCFRQAEIIIDAVNHKTQKILNKISIYKRSESNNDVLSKIISSGFDYVLIDFGSDFAKIRNEFLMCNAKIMVGSLTMWKIHEYVRFLAATQNEFSRKNWTFLGTFPAHKGKEYLQHIFKVKILTVPYEPDPLYLGAASLDFLQKFTEIFL